MPLKVGLKCQWHRKVLVDVQSGSSPLHIVANFSGLLTGDISVCDCLVHSASKVLSALKIPMINIWTQHRSRQEAGLSVGAVTSIQAINTTHVYNALGMAGFLPPNPWCFPSVMTCQKQGTWRNIRAQRMASC